MISEALDIEPVLADYFPPGESTNIVLTTKEQVILRRIRESQVTDLTAIKPMETAITIAGTTFARFGDFSLVMGQRKAGKTRVLQYMVATALMAHVPNEMDTMQIRTAYAGEKLVVYVDTEGSYEDTFDFIEGVKRIMGVSEMPENFLVFHWRENTQKECREFFDVFFKVYTDVHLCVIDGAADIVAKPNDEGESNETVRFIMKSAGEANACIVCVIHDNPVKAGQETKARGHFGSELERKASGAISVEKNREEKRHYIKCRFLRKSDDFDPIMFWFENGHPVSRALTLEERSNLSDRNYQKIKSLTTLRDRCFLGLDGKSDKDLKRSIELYQTPSAGKEANRKKRDRNIAELLEHNLIRAEPTDTGLMYHPVRESAAETAF